MLKRYSTPLRSHINDCQAAPRSHRCFSSSRIIVSLVTGLEAAQERNVLYRIGVANTAKYRQRTLLYCCWHENFYNSESKTHKF